MYNISVVLYQTRRADIERLLSVSAELSGLHRLYLIDNSPSSDVELEAFARQHADRVDYRHEPTNLGYGKAHNIALRCSLQDGVPYHLVVNADVEFTQQTLSRLQQVADADPSIALLSPKVYYPNGELQRLCKLLPTPLDLFGRRFLPERLTARRRRRFELWDSGYDKVMNLPYLSGCFMFLRTEALRDVGLFDERYFMYPEDIDLTRRLHRKYQTLFYPEVSVIHNHEQASYKSLRMTWIHVVNLARYFCKWGWLFDRERREFNSRVCRQYLPEKS